MPSASSRIGVGNQEHEASDYCDHLHRPANRLLPMPNVRDWLYHASTLREMEDEFQG
jgi:hypothetical protein